MGGNIENKCGMTEDKALNIITQKLKQAENVIRNLLIRYGSPCQFCTYFTTDAECWKQGGKDGWECKNFHSV